MSSEQHPLQLGLLCCEPPSPSLQPRGGLTPACRGGVRAVIIFWDLILTSCICIMVCLEILLSLSVSQKTQIICKHNERYLSVILWTCSHQDTSVKTRYLLLSVYLWPLFQAQQRDSFVQERYGQYDLRDPFVALLRDSELSQAQDDGGQSPVCLNPLGVLKLVMAHCTNMKEKMMKQLAAAERRHRRVRDKKNLELHTWAVYFGS